MPASELTENTDIETGKFLIRDAAPSDIPAIQGIYRQAVEEGTASFEEIAPDIEEMARRQKALQEKNFPYLVAIERETGQLCGYAYAGPYRPRAAYRHSIEDSIYILPEFHGQGIGSILMQHLIARCEKGPWRQMVAVIGDSQNKGSIALHRKYGFELVGTLRNIGFKLDRWLDCVLMQRPLK
ncbi:GCN5 family acetyltransferase [Thalassospira sp. TSL5-1]|nr:GCN5 family acetyltransferase [Thalassospira sp. TSL5-1]